MPTLWLFPLWWWYSHTQQQLHTHNPLLREGQSYSTLVVRDTNWFIILCLVVHNCPGALKLNVHIRSSSTYLFWYSVCANNTRTTDKSCNHSWGLPCTAVSVISYNWCYEFIKKITKHLIMAFHHITLHLCCKRKN